MDNSLTLARHFARLVWLLIHESHATDEQKVALRAVVLVSKEASVRLGNSEGRLAVNGLVMPQALTGVQELAGRLAGHAISEIEIEQEAPASELLSLARLLAVGASSTSDAADFAAKVASLEGRTVRVRLADASSKPSAESEEQDARAEAAALPGDQRLRQLFTRLAKAENADATSSALEEIAVMAEQATREGRTGDVADLFSGLLDHEERVTDPESRRSYLVIVRRLTKPTLLRPIANLLSAERARTAQTERILQRCGQDGVDAVVDQFGAATTSAERRMYREALFRLATARESLVQMLADPRWYIVRQAAEFLGEMGAAEAERALADLLRHQDERVRRAATRAVGRIDTGFTLDALARALTDDAPAVRLEAVSALAARKGPRAGAALAASIDKEAEPEVQYAIIAALGRVATPEAVQKLSGAAAAAIGLFKSKKNSGLRVAAVQALGEAHTPGALATLQGLANDREKEVRDAVARTLLSQRGTAA